MKLQQAANGNWQVDSSSQSDQSTFTDTQLVSIRDESRLNRLVEIQLWSEEFKLIEAKELQRVCFMHTIVCVQTNFRGFASAKVFALSHVHHYGWFACFPCVLCTISRSSPASSHSPQTCTLGLRLRLFSMRYTGEDVPHIHAMPPLIGSYDPAQRGAYPVGG